MCWEVIKKLWLLWAYCINLSAKFISSTFSRLKMLTKFDSSQNSCKFHNCSEIQHKMNVLCLVLNHSRGVTDTSLSLTPILFYLFISTFASSCWNVPRLLSGSQFSALPVRCFSVICPEPHKEPLQDVYNGLFTPRAISCNSGGGAL